MLISQVLKYVNIASRPFWGGWVIAAFATLAQAEPASAYQNLAQEWLQKNVQSIGGAGVDNLRWEVSVGSLDSRLRLADCGKVEPFLPVGSRAWGRTRVGLRCVDGVARWNVTLAATVKAFGPAWVVKTNVPAGKVLGDADVIAMEVDWAEETPQILLTRADWSGQVASRTLTTGQTLRQGMVKPVQVFQAGTPVRAVANGAGFQVSADAQALSAGVVGELARIRMENGRVTSGVVLDAKTVKIDL